MNFSEGQFNIPDVIVDQVSADLGVPILELEDLGLNRDKLVNIAIVPALRLYWSYYPLILKQEYPIVGFIDLEFPNEEVFSVAMARVATLQNDTKLGRNPFINEAILRKWGSSRSYGKTPDGRDPYQRASLLISEYSESQSYINLSRAGNFNIDIENRRLWGYSNVQGNLVINWAMFSRDWGKVRFEHESDVVDVSKMYALRFIGGIRAQSDPNTGVTADGSTFISRADQIEQDIIKDKWKMRKPLVVLH